MGQRSGFVRLVRDGGRLSHRAKHRKDVAWSSSLKSITGDRESWGIEGGVECERGWGTYASRVQQVSPSTSPPGALSVLTDSFSLAGMLTERQRGGDAGKREMTDRDNQKKEGDISINKTGKHCRQIYNHLKECKWTLQQNKSVFSLLFYEVMFFIQL